jgi:hypothetical protein
MSGPESAKIYNFNIECEEQFCFVRVKGKFVCLLCGVTVSATNKHNVERHLEGNHNDFDTNFLLFCDVQKKRVRDPRSEPSFQRSVFIRPVQQSKKYTLASCNVTHVLFKMIETF